VQLDHSLLDSPYDMERVPTELKACLNAHGLYNSIQFVLRLSPEVHRKIEAMPTGIVEGGVDFDGVQAFSTYLHETVHWWQHIGSTTGLMLSLSYPGQAHANYKQLKSLIGSIGPKKSILRVVETTVEPGGFGTPRGEENFVVNTHFDIEFFRILITNPLMAPQAIEHPLFDCIGHSYQIAYGNIALVLASTLDNDFKVFPDPRGWSEPFAALRAKKRQGFYYRSDVRLVPMGAHEIFEGQARFSQLQYLYFASGSKLQWDDVRSMGMLKGIYAKAFQEFLNLAELEWPASIGHPVVALFMLVCDIAINPGAGFPMPLRHFQTFIEDVDPGFRFVFLCRAIAKQRPDLVDFIKHYSREEYLEVSEALCQLLIVEPPLTIAKAVASWRDGAGELKSLTEEHRSFAYGPRNLPVRLLFAHFMAFCEDKLARPEVFCWPGAWMTGERVSPEIVALFERQSAPFVDKANDGGIYPRLMAGKDEATVQSSFDSFYAMNVTYDLTRQWIAMPGPFEYEYGWLSSTAEPKNMRDFAAHHFEKIYGVHPDKFKLV
jgi:hypothetical protein